MVTIHMLECSACVGTSTHISTFSFWLALIGFTATNGEFYDIVREGLVQCICGDKHTHFLLLCFMSDGLHHTCIDMQS